MRQNQLGTIGPVSAVCLGGGGFGGVWGPVSHDDAVATVRHAIASGVTLLDTSPGYGACEQVIADAFDGALDPGVLVTTKIWFDADAPDGIAAQSRKVVADSARAMKLARIHILLLHNGIVADDTEGATRPRGSVLHRRYVDEIAPALAALVADGVVDHWGITAGSGSPAVLEALSNDPRPAVAQVPTNLLDSGGDMSPEAGVSHRVVVARAAGLDVGVMGIRVLQAGALAAEPDRPLAPAEPVAQDRDRAAPFLALCRRIGTDPVVHAYRYALGMPGVATLVAGAKTRLELDAALLAEALGPLTDAESHEVNLAVRDR